MVTLILPIVVLWACVIAQMLLTIQHRKAMARAERRRVALLQQTALLKTLWIHRSCGNVDAALLTLERFHEHDEALLAEFPELKPKCAFQSVAEVGRDAGRLPAKPSPAIQ